MLARVMLWATIVASTCGVSPAATTFALRVAVVDQDSGQPLPARLTLVSADGLQHFWFTSEPPEGSAVKYDKQNWLNAKSIERHTTISAHPAVTQLAPGQYELTVQHGQAYIPVQQRVDVVQSDQQLEIKLKRWCDPASRGWFSGDTHIHRTVDELRNVVLAEDLNVVLPLTSWVTESDRPPANGDKNIADSRLSELIQVDQSHVIWPRNTEYEIFKVGQRQHTLGALFVLGHASPLQTTVPPWGELIQNSTQDPLTLLDTDKLDWPFAMLLPTLAPQALVELSNNHTWQTEFAFRDWNSPAPAYMHPPYGGKSGGHRQWLDYTHGMYYTLLNCGLRLPPTAGTANGVHPVPAGFGRVYVNLPQGFSYEAWMKALKAGRSMVTTGPMLFVTANDQPPGAVFQAEAAHPQPIALSVEVSSLHPLLYGEVLVNGRPEVLLNAQNIQSALPGQSSASTAQVVYRTKLNATVTPKRSGWLAVRFYQRHPDGQVRFAHTAPWYVEVDQQPVLPTRQEKAYLVERMQAEIQRSGDIVSAPARAEYQRGLEFYQRLSTYDDSADVLRNARPARSPDELAKWQTIFAEHRLTHDEVHHATGLPLNTLQKTPKSEQSTGSGLRLYPYPGGRHPRRGFLDGAIDPQRESKISIFPPWDKHGDSGYVVVDVPEAIFSNLGLIYLAHSHVPTIWDKENRQLEKLEWQINDQALTIERRLPNGITFESTVRKTAVGAKMRIVLSNGTREKLTGLRVQVCMMLGSLIGFNVQEPLESIEQPPYVAVRGTDSSRWLVTHWTPNQRVWQNAPVPCIHSDPIFPDCAPGQSVEVSGEVQFYEGDQVRSVMK